VTGAGWTAATNWLGGSLAAKYGRSSKLRCEDVQDVIDAFVDGEIHAVTQLEIDEHLQFCSPCSITRQNREVLRSLIRRRSPGPYTPGRYSLYHEAPVHLEPRIRSALRTEVRSEASHRPGTRRWIAAAASIALIAVSILSITLVARRNSSQDPLAREVISSHVRSFMGNRLTDLLSSDEHTIKTWFNGKLDFAPSVENLADKDFTLLGGRIEYLRNRPIAVLVYRRQEHIINLFTWPSGNDSESADRTMTCQGYNLVSWTGSGMDCWAVSDLDANELRGFAQVFQEQYSSECPS
jgi:anti-sigma factor RsiW